MKIKSHGKYTILLTDKNTPFDKETIRRECNGKRILYDHKAELLDAHFYILLGLEYDVKKTYGSNFKDSLENYCHGYEYLIILSN